MSIPNTLFSVLSFISFFLVSIPLPWHLKAWNVGTCLYSVWTALSLLVYFINSIVGMEYAMYWAPVWCDISTRLIACIAIAIPAASLCINRGLYNITTLQGITWSKAQRRRTIIIDLAIGIGIPVLFMALQYVVRCARFMVFEEFGCYPALRDTPMTYVLVCGPPAVLGLVSAYYAVMSVMIRRRTEEALKKQLFNTSGFNRSLYHRLLALACIEVFILGPTLFNVIETVTLGPCSRGNSWSGTHWTISEMLMLTSGLWKDNDILLLQLETRRWTALLWAFNFFALVGLTGEARRNYKMAWHFCMKPFGFNGTRDKTQPLRFKAFSELFSLRGSRTVCDPDIFTSPGGFNSDRAPPDSTRDQNANRGEPLPESPVIDIVHVC